LKFDQTAFGHFKVKKNFLDRHLRTPTFGNNQSH